MEFLNNKQKVILALVGIGMLIFIGYYIIKKTENSNYIELPIIEENNIVNEDIINNEKEGDKKQKNIIHITGEVNSEGIIEIEERGQNSRCYR